MATLCTWRITHLLVAEDGPGEMVVRVRRRLGEGFWGRLLDCFYCLSVWVAAPLAYPVSETWIEWLLHWPALSGAAVLLDRFTAGPTVEPLPVDQIGTAVGDSEPEMPDATRIGPVPPPDDDGPAEPPTRLSRAHEGEV